MVAAIVVVGLATAIVDIGAATAIGLATAIGAATAIVGVVAAARRAVVASVPQLGAVSSTDPRALAEAAHCHSSKSPFSSAARTSC